MPADSTDNGPFGKREENKVSVLQSDTLKCAGCCQRASCPRAEQEQTSRHEGLRRLWSHCVSFSIFVFKG